MSTQLLAIKTRFTDDTGAPLKGGQVYTFYAGTSTPKETYKDVDLLIPNTNPVILDDTGAADIYLKGSYRIRVLDRFGALIEEQDDVSKIISRVDAGELVGSLVSAITNLSDTKSEIEKVKLDTGITVTPQGVGMVARTQAQVNADRANVKTFGVDITGGVDSTESFKKALEYCELYNIALDLMGGTILTRGGHTYSGTLLSQNATLKRTANYTGKVPILVLGDNSEIQGSITFDGNNPSESGTFADSYQSLRVDGKNVSISGKLTLLNTPMYSQGEKQLSGCQVYGDNFSCGDVYGNLCGYRTMGLRITGQMKSFRVGNVQSYNHHYKGFGVGGETGSTIKNIIIGNIIASTPDSFAHAASEGLLVDCDNDNRKIYVQSMSVGYIDITGGRSNCLKVENVKNFSCSDINLDVTTTLSAGNAMRMEAENFNCGSITFNKNRIRLRSLNVSIANIVCEHPTGAEEAQYVIFEGLTAPSSDPKDISIFGNRSYCIGSITTKSETSISHLFGINIKQDVTYTLRVDNIDAPHITYYFANYDLDAGGRDRLISGNVSVGKCNDRYKLHADSNLQKLIGDGNRVFYSRSGAPTFGSYKITDYVYNAKATIQGGKPDQYIVKGWICTTAGDSSAFAFTAERITVS